MDLYPILLAEGSKEEASCLRRAVQEAGILDPIFHVEDGQQAIDYLAGLGPFANRAKYPLPMLVFLDLKLPAKTGNEVLEWIRAQPQFDKLIIIVLAPSSEPIDLNRSYRLGANSFVVKPATAKQLLELAEAFKLWWLRQNRVN